MPLADADVLYEQLKPRPLVRYTTMSPVQGETAFDFFLRRALQAPLSLELGRGKGFLRLLLLLVAAALVAAVAANFGIARDYGYLRASILTGAAGAIIIRLRRGWPSGLSGGTARCQSYPTAGSIENVSRLTSGQARCSEIFALIQDGTPVSADAKLELLGRLPEPESLLLLGRPGNAFHTFADLRGASIGVGPQGSGTGLHHASALPRLRSAGAGCPTVISRVARTDPPGGARASSTLPPS
jgi:hypothetical protein